VKEAIIQTEKLIKVFPASDSGEDNVVLNGINLEIESGEIFGVIGKSGAGKSTFVRCVNYLEKPTAGEIVFDGTKLSGLSKKELYKARRSMGMIFQQFNLLSQRDALRNICFPLEIAGWDKKKARARAVELLGGVGMEDKEKSYPSQLSGGQQQRVAIARAIALNPKVLLCDEATSALDPETTRGVLALLKDINRQYGITIIVITHEMSVIENVCDRVAVLDGGNLAEVGAVSDVFMKPKSDAAKSFIYPGGVAPSNVGLMQDQRYLRIVFKGNSSFEPVFSGLVLSMREKINILHADTQDVGGLAYGQMLLQIPEDPYKAEAIKDYLEAHGLEVEEVSEYVQQS
jgi:D-methionine transport system ATP-binding protein